MPDQTVCAARLFVPVADVTDWPLPDVVAPAVVAAPGRRSGSAAPGQSPAVQGVHPAVY